MKTKDKIKYQIIEPMDIRFDPRVTNIEKHWWHKLLFWKKYVYLDDNFVITREYKTLKEVLQSNGIMKESI